MLGGGRHGDLGECALDDLVSVLRRGHTVVEVCIKIVGQAGAGGKTGDNSARPGGYVKLNVMGGLGCGGRSKGILSSRETRFALEVLV